MTNIFAPKTSAQVTPVAPVAPVEEQNPLSFLDDATDFLKGAVKANATRGSKGVDPSVLKEFSVQVQMAKNIEDTRGAQAGGVAFKQLFDRWSGYDLSDDAFSTEFTSQTGKEWKYRGLSQAEQAELEVRNSAEYQTSFLAARATLGIEASDDEVDREAMNQMQSLAMAEQQLLSYSKERPAAFLNAGGVVKSAQLLTDKHNINFSAFTQAVANGSVISQESILAYKAQLAQEYQALNMNMPGGLTAEQRRPFEKAFEDINSQIDTMIELTSSDTASEDLIRNVIKPLKDSGTSPVQMAMALKIIKEGDISALTGAGVSFDRDTFGKLFGKGALEVPDADKLFSFPAVKAAAAPVLDQSSKTGTSIDQNPIDLDGDDVPEEIKTSAKIIEGLDKDGAERYARQVGTLLGSITNEAYKTPEGKEAWAKHMMRLGVLMKKKSKLVFDAKTLNSFFSESFQRRLTDLYKTDPTTAQTISSYLQTGINEERVAQTIRIEGMETRAPVVWNEKTKKYNFSDEKAMALGIPSRTILEFEKAINERLNGDLSKMREANLGVAEDMPQAGSLIRIIGDLHDSRKSLAKVTDTQDYLISMARGDEPEDEVPLIKAESEPEREKLSLLGQLVEGFKYRSAELNEEGLLGLGGFIGRIGNFVRDGIISEAKAEELLLDIPEVEKARKVISKGQEQPQEQRLLPSGLTEVIISTLPPIDPEVLAKAQEGGSTDIKTDYEFLREQLERAFWSTGKSQFNNTDMEAVTELMKGESGGRMFKGNEYNAWNRGSGLDWKVPDKPVANNIITNTSIKEVIERSELDRDDPNRLFAVGKYQIIPSTLKWVMKELKIPEETKLTEDIQDKIFKAILTGKRPVVGRFLKGFEDESKKDEVLLEFAKEWASAGIPKDATIRGKELKKGDSYYSGVGGNKAHITPDEVWEYLNKLRDSEFLVTPGNKKAKALQSEGPPSIPPKRPESLIG